MLIITKNLEIGYRKAILPPINVSADQGDLIAMIGPNGAGKSTLFKTLTGSIKPISGEVELLGRNITSYSPKEKARLMSIVLTSKPDDLFLKVSDVVASGRFPYSGFFGKISEEDERIIKSSLELAGVIQLIDRNFNSLSDGEKQKVMIAKSLAQDTPVIFMDEPTAFLDYPSKIELLNLMKNLTEKHKKTVIFSSHDLELVLRYTNSLWILSPGKPLISGSSLDLLQNGIVSDYLHIKEDFYIKKS